MLGTCTLVVADRLEPGRESAERVLREAGARVGPAMAHAQPPAALRQAGPGGAAGKRDQVLALSRESASVSGKAQHECAAFQSAIQKRIGIKYKSEW